MRPAKRRMLSDPFDSKAVVDSYYCPRHGSPARIAARCFWVSINASIVLDCGNYSGRGEDRGRSGSPGAIEGEVRDSSGAAVSGCRVAVTNIATGLKRTTESTSEGIFRLPLLPVGDYMVEAEADRFARFEKSDLRVNVGQTIRLPIKLDIAARKDAVTISGDAPLVDTATNISAKLFRDAKSRSFR